jgi:ubiquitin C-terminal hydrolase
LVSSLLRNNAPLKDLLGVQGDSTDEEESLLKTITRCLFDLPNTNFESGHSIPPPKCKSSHSRNAAFAVLNEMCKGSVANFDHAVEFLVKNHLVGHSGGKYKPTDRQWTFEVKKTTEESRQAYVGLVNLGCICYMNAANQQFFMIPKLRSNVLAIDEYDDPDNSKSTVYNFQKIMGYLQESGQHAINPKPWCDVWTDEFGDPINVGKQEDSHGYVNRLIDRFSETLRNTRHKMPLRMCLVVFCSIRLLVLATVSI